jgi:hypothetical protein
MVDVSEWAKREAERRYPASWEDRGRTNRDDERDAFWEGAHAWADLLLSDEAAIAAAKRLAAYFPGHEVTFDLARAVLAAAVSAVTTTNPTSPISETGEQ